MRTRLTIKPNGKVQSCEVEKSNGNKALDGFTCRLFERRARLRPAVWTNGSPSYGVFRFNFEWIRDGTAPPAVDTDPVDLDVPIARTNFSGPLPATLHVVFAVDQDGRIGQCSGDAPVAANVTPNPPALVSLACEAIIYGYIAKPAEDGLGHSVRSVQNAIVRIRSN